MCLPAKWCTVQFHGYPQLKSSKRAYWWSKGPKPSTKRCSNNLGAAREGMGRESTLSIPFWRSLETCNSTNHHAFADASDLAACYVLYLRTIATDKQVHVTFVCGSNKAHPKGVHFKGQQYIKRCELNADNDLDKKVLEVEQEFELPKDICLPSVLYTDSKDAPAWVKNGSTKEPIPRYIFTRITSITTCRSPNQSVYIPAKDKLADIGTRLLSAK